jgi:hypothetical protein
MFLDSVAVGSVPVTGDPARRVARAGSEVLDPAKLLRALTAPAFHASDDA